MTMSTRTRLPREPFTTARVVFLDLLEWAETKAPLDHAAFEEDLFCRGTEVLRVIFQNRLDQLSAIETAEFVQPDGASVRQRSRQLMSTFGRLCFRRLGHKRPGETVWFPLDAMLNLPTGMYTHRLSRRVVEEGRAGSWEAAVKQIEETTGGHVPKRQAEALAVAAAQDFDAFNALPLPANQVLGADALLIASSDSKGVRMLPTALREATRKTAAAEALTAVRGDPMAEKKPRSHDRRMAVVTAVWEQQPVKRAAQDIVSELRRAPRAAAKRTKLPRPENKRLAASLEHGVTIAIKKMFDEIDRRDPTRQRRLIALVDGEECQQGAILWTAGCRERPVTIVLDLIHVLHYLWMAGFALCRKNQKKTDVWLAEHLLLLLSEPVERLIEAIERTAKTRRLNVGERKSVNRALRYFDRNRTFMDYPSFLANGFPIATGVIEGACRHLVQDRLGITGARWDLPGAEAVLRLRALDTSGDWDAYWRFHRQQESLRNHPVARAAA